MRARGQGAEVARGPVAGWRSRARRGARTSCGSAASSTCVASRLLFLAGMNMLLGFNVLFLQPLARHRRAEQSGSGSRSSAWSSASRPRVATMPSARLSNRIGRKPVIYVACVVGALGLAVAALAPTPQVLVLGVVAPRALPRDVPRGRLGAHDRHHPEGLVRPVHGHQQHRRRAAPARSRRSSPGRSWTWSAAPAETATARARRSSPAIALFALAAFFLRPRRSDAARGAAPEVRPRAGRHLTDRRRSLRGPLSAHRRAVRVR